jgi:hypothetical protein
MDGFHRSLKVETRVRTPLGVLTVEPQVVARFVPLTWGFLVLGDHLVVSGSCHAVRPMMGRGPEIGSIARDAALNGRACPRPSQAHHSRAAGARRAARRRDVLA